MGKKSGSGSGINIPDHISESFEAIFWIKYLNSLMRIRDPGWKKSDPGWKEFGYGIRDEHLGSATLAALIIY
jgi:hypothetical protein